MSQGQDFLALQMQCPSRMERAMTRLRFAKSFIASPARSSLLCGHARCFNARPSASLPQQHECGKRHRHNTWVDYGSFVRLGDKEAERRIIDNLFDESSQRLGIAERINTP